MIKKIIEKGIKKILNKKMLISKHIEIMPGTRIDPQSNISDYTYIGHNCVITRADIGRYSSIADNVTIGPGEHKINNISTSGLFYANGAEEATKEDCIIGPDVWIGVDSIILRGVKIGIGAIIGANSVVTKDIPPFAIAVGNPARVIKYRFNKNDILIIEKSKWWEYSLEEAKKIQEKIQSNLSTQIK